MVETDPDTVPAPDGFHMATLQTVPGLPSAGRERKVRTMYVCVCVCACVRVCVCVRMCVCVCAWYEV